jgi:hypothetical protein
VSSRTYIIGRRGEITLNDDTVSARHAELTLVDDTCFLSDLGSTNGTWLVESGQRMAFSRGYVTPEQEFAFGNCVRSISQLISSIESLRGGGDSARSGSRSSGMHVVDIRPASEDEGSRKRCGSCGAVVLLGEVTCPICGGQA